MGNTFPYQETEAYKNLIMEYREKVFSGMKDVSTEEPLILSCEEKNKEFGQSFTLEGCQERMNVISKFKCRIVNAFKVVSLKGQFTNSRLVIEVIKIIRVFPDKEI